MPRKHVCFRVERIRPLHGYSIAHIAPARELNADEQAAALAWLGRHPWHIVAAGVQTYGDYNCVISALVDPLSTQEFLAIVRVPAGIAMPRTDLFPVEVGA